MPKFTAQEDVIRRLVIGLESADRKLELVLATNNTKEHGYAGSVCLAVRRVIRAALRDCGQDKSWTAEVGSASLADQGKSWTAEVGSASLADRTSPVLKQSAAPLADEAEAVCETKSFTSPEVERAIQRIKIAKT